MKEAEKKIADIITGAGKEYWGGTLCDINPDVKEIVIGTTDGGYDYKPNVQANRNGNGDPITEHKYLPGAVLRIKDLKNDDITITPMGYVGDDVKSYTLKALKRLKQDNKNPNYISTSNPELAGTSDIAVLNFPENGNYVYADYNWRPFVSNGLYIIPLSLYHFSSNSGRISPVRFFASVSLQVSTA
ncbi:MAG: hypothetical protein K5668_03985 [Lachnospiraceae bacterium]|nr:hypothetical protein [Lachnospiraceae bacterium]